MEPQDVKVGRINDVKGASLIDQIALMQLQRELSAGKREESTIFKEGAERLKNIENLMAKMVEEMVAIRKLLESSDRTKVVRESAGSG
ncbi:MAG: hypothetical protein OXG49_03075 [Chloroflexi bacterium]|nr:hypothetical protein [Chloroflexota bacterium]